MEAEWRQLSSSYPKSLEEREEGKTENKALNGLESSKACLKPFLEPARSPKRADFKPDMSSCRKDRNTNLL